MHSKDVKKYVSLYEGIPLKSEEVFRIPSVNKLNIWIFKGGSTIELRQVQNGLSFLCIFSQEGSNIYEKIPVQ